MNRASFFALLEPHLASSELIDVQLAYTLAKYGHRAQKRRELAPGGGYMRYFEHVRRVATTLITEAGVTDSTMVIAALLHDTLEDTRDITPLVIERAFGADVCRMVKALSKIPREGYTERLANNPDWRVILIKACDRLDNLRSLDSQPDKAFAAKIRAETRDVYWPIFCAHNNRARPAIAADALSAINSKIIDQMYKDVEIDD